MCWLCCIGKTNNGQTLYGRLMRHKDVRMCGFGALAFYLLYRFQCTGEMSPPPDFTDNSTWFDIKLLVDCTSSSNSKAMNSNIYARAIKEVLKELGIFTNHYLHIGRVLGPILAEFNEAPSGDIQCLGNWRPSMQQQRYSSKIPLGIIRTMAGFTMDASVHYNTRTAVEPPECLVLNVFPWVDECMRQVQTCEDSTGSNLCTAQAFLGLMSQLRIIALQDAAAMRVLHPERCDNPLFSLPVFQSDEFNVSLFLYCLYS